MADPSTCSVCARPDLSAIDAAIAAGEGLNATARRFELSRATLQRHAKHRSGRQEPPPKPPVLPPVEVIPPVEVVPIPPARPSPPPESGDDLIAYVNELAEGQRRAGRKPDPEASPRVGKGGRCAVCISPKRARVDALLVEGLAPHAIEMAVAPGPSDDSIRHHAERCIPALLARYKGQQEVQLIASVRGRVQALLEQAERLVADAEGNAEATPRDRAATITAAKGVLELLARILGEIRTDVDLRVVMASPHFVQAMEAVRRGLRRHPEARADVAEELEALEARQAPRLVGAA